MKKSLLVVTMAVTVGVLTACSSGAEPAGSSSPTRSVSPVAESPAASPATEVVEPSVSVEPPTCWDVVVPANITFSKAWTPEQAKESYEATAGEGAGAVDVFPCSLVADGSHKEAADAWVAALVAEGWQAQPESGDDNYWQGGATSPDGRSVMFTIGKPDRGFAATSSFDLFAPM